MPLTTISFTFQQSNHAWAKAVGLHNYVLAQPLLTGTPLTLTHNPANPVHGNAIEVRRAADGAMIGHLRYQVSDVLRDVVDRGWTISAVTTEAGHIFTDPQGRDFVECNIDITVRVVRQGMVHNLGTVLFILGPLMGRAHDFPYDAPWIDG